MKWLLRSFATVLVISSSGFVFTNKALAQITVTTGEPGAKGGELTARASSGNTGTTVTIKVPPGTTDIGKAELLKNAFGNPPRLPGGQAQNPVGTTREGNKLIFGMNVKKFEILLDQTAEKTKLGTEKLGKARATKIDGHYIELETLLPSSLSLAGLDDNGNESTFVSSLGFETSSESVLASSSFSFSQLGGNDIDNWLSTIFTNLQGQLPVVYQSNLSLDLNNDEISFIFPENILLGTGFVEHGSTDINVSSSMNLEAENVPEPLTILGSATAVGFGAFFKRKLKSSKSTEKETINVG